jgi:hypothetical protein
MAETSTTGHLQLPLFRVVPDSFTDSFGSYNDAVKLYTLAFSLGHVLHMVEVDGIHDQSAAPATPHFHHRSLG